MISAAEDIGLTNPLEYSVEAVGPRDWVSEVQSSWPPVVLPGCLTLGI